jgi:integrase/recombinase XerD
MGVMSKHIPYKETLNSFTAFVQLKDLSKRTVTSYVANVRLAGEHFDTDPALLDEDQIRSYFLFLRTEKKYATSTMNQARVSLKTFYHYHLKLPLWPVFAEIKTRHSETLPVVISREEVRELLAAVTEPRYHTLFSLLYSCGLRLSEALHLEVKDIDAKKLKIHVRKGKGGKDRYVPISIEMIHQLRAWWRHHKHPRLIFPTAGRGWRKSKRGNYIDQQQAQHEAMHKAEKPMSPSSAQAAMQWAAAASRQKKKVTSHTLRHCYATHMLEGGAHMRHISSYLGHASLKETMVYLHLTSIGEEQTQLILNTLYSEVIEQDTTPPPQ